MTFNDLKKIIIHGNQRSELEAVTNDLNRYWKGKEVIPTDKC